MKKIKLSTNSRTFTKHYLSLFLNRKSPNLNQFKHLTNRNGKRVRTIDIARLPSYESPYEGPNVLKNFSTLKENHDMMWWTNSKGKNEEYLIDLANPWIDKRESLIALLYMIGWGFSIIWFYRYFVRPPQHFHPLTFATFQLTPKELEESKKLIKIRNEKIEKLNIKLE